MTVHARRIASIPRRSPVETWQAVCALVSAPGSPARAELESITGLAAALVTEEYTSNAPILISGTGPQVRVYTLHGESAIGADPTDELPLNRDPTSGEWTLSLPCAADDLDEARDAASRATHVQVRALVADEGPRSTAATANPIRRPTIDLTALER